MDIEEIEDLITFNLSFGIDVTETLCMIKKISPERLQNLLDEIKYNYINND